MSAPVELSRLALLFPIRNQSTINKKRTLYLNPFKYSVNSFYLKCYLQVYTQFNTHNL